MIAAFSAVNEQTMKSNRLILISVSFLVAGLAACNRDDTIPDEVIPGQAGELIVYEYTPAPGQFINEGNDFSTPREAAEWATARLRNRKYVSLGAFGGYIVAGFGGPIGDFIVEGNAFTNSGGASNEPGIVYVMQDSNRNGLPDDTWYELRGSDTDLPSTLRDYAVMYFRPDGPGQPVKWRDSLGREGEVEYLGSFHSQDSYYPSWIETDSYTLDGTRLADNSTMSDTGFWHTLPLDWGYADNTGTNDNVFRIADAIDGNGKPAGLTSVDFIKIQTGVMGKCGVLGEISTEVTSISLLE